jgi:hypothetical protein
MAKSNTQTISSTSNEVSVHPMLAIVSQQASTPKASVDGSQAAELVAKYGDVSKAIRALTALGHDRGAVAKMLNKRYQHVRNVLITPISKKA